MRFFFNFFSSFSEVKTDRYYNHHHLCAHSIVVLRLVDRKNVGIILQPKGHTLTLAAGLSPCCCALAAGGTWTWVFLLHCLLPKPAQVLEHNTRRSGEILQFFSLSRDKNACSIKYTLVKINCLWKGKAPWHGAHLSVKRWRYQSHFYKVGFLILNEANIASFFYGGSKLIDLSIIRVHVPFWNPALFPSK